MLYLTDQGAETNRCGVQDDGYDRTASA
jgi:hypothetical protein